MSTLNGTIQLRSYTEPVRCKQCDNPYEDTPCFDYYILDPFTFHKVKDYDSIKGKSSDSSVLNQFRSANRTKQQVFTYARAGNWQWFITLTFDSAKTDRYDYHECSKKARKWFNNLKRVASDLQYLIVPEQHKDGAWHFHGLLAKCGNIRFTDSGRVTKKSHIPIYNMDNWKFGFSTATQVTSVDKVSKYIGKYITKGLCDSTKGKHRYFCSNNLSLPKVSTMFIDNDEKYDVIEKLSQSFGKKIAHVSQTCAEDDSFTKVMYYELN